MIRKKQAIEILTNQRNKIVNKTVSSDEAWVFQTASCIKDFFGQESTEYNFISRFSFSVLLHSGMSNDEKRYAIDSNKKGVLQFLDNCIETIEFKGVYKAPKKNFLQNLNDTALWTIISLVVPGLITIGYLFGQFTSDTKNYELRQDNQQLREKLSIQNKPMNTDSLSHRGLIKKDTLDQIDTSIH